MYKPKIDKALKNHRPALEKPNKISWFDMLIYRLFRWRWNSILEKHPGILKGMYDSMGSTLDSHYPGLRDKEIDWTRALASDEHSTVGKSSLQLVVDNTKVKSQPKNSK